MGGKKTAGTIYNEAFALLKANYKVLWVMALILYGIEMVLGMVMSIFMVPFQFAFIGLGPVLESMMRGAGDPVAVLLPVLSVFGVLYLVIMVLAFLTSIAQSTFEVGRQNASLQLAEGRKPAFEPVWQDFTRNWKRYAAVSAWTVLFTALWSLLFIVPGIIKSYSYRLAPYLLVQYPDMTPREAIRKSMEMTQGYKGRLFLLDLIMVGFSLLSLIGVCVLVVGMLAIQLLWILPLYYAMTAIAYLDIRRAAIEKGLLPAAALE